jgi:dUTP pyrophosphatase
MIELKWLKLHSQAKVPAPQSKGAACFDLCASFDGESLTLKPGEITLIPTGLAVEIPEGFEMQVRARSGLAAKSGLALVNGIGTIDSDYRGELKIIAIVLGSSPLTIKPGDRVAQALIAPVLRVAHTVVETLTTTERAEKGFGSTGIST